MEFVNFGFQKKNTKSSDVSVVGLKTAGDLKQEILWKKKIGEHIRSKENSSY